MVHNGFVVERQMYRDFHARVFSWATVARHWRTGIFIPTGSTTHVLKREIRCCAYYTYELCRFPNGEGESGAFLLKMYHCMRLTPPPHPLTGLPVWCGLRWLSIRHEASPQGHAKSHSLPLPFLAFFMAMRVLPHRDSNDLCLVSFLKMMKIVLSSQT